MLKQSNQHKVHTRRLCLTHYALLFTHHLRIGFGTSFGLTEAAMAEFDLPDP